MIRRVCRALFVASCVTIVAQQTNLGSLVFSDECYDGCPDDPGSHRCPLGCTACGCVGHGSPLTVGSGTPPMEPLASAPIERDGARQPEDPQPSAIFHVPKSILS